MTSNNNIIQQQQRLQTKGGISNAEHDGHTTEIGSQFVVKCVVVGDQGVGKSHLVCARASGAKYTLRDLVLQIHISSVWAVDQYRDNNDVRRRSHCDIDGVSCSLRIWDTFGNHDKDRQYSYSRADVVVICFSAINRRSLMNIEKFWIPEVRQMCGATVPLVICGCQIDYRYLFHEPAYINLDKGPYARKIKESDIVLPEEGRAIARKFGACYYETSVLAQYGINDVFNNAVRACLFQKRRSQIFSKIGNLKHVTKPHLQVPHLPPKPIQPEFVPPPPVTSQLRPARSRHELQTYCDVTFIVDGGIRFYAHWVYLIVASPSFHQLYQRRCQLLNLSHSDFISMGTSSDGGSSSRSQSSSDATLNSWLPPWRRDGVRVRMSTRIRYLSQNLSTVAKKTTTSVSEMTDRLTADSSSDLVDTESTSFDFSRHQLNDRRPSLQIDVGGERFGGDAFDRQSHASSVLTLKPLDLEDDDDDDHENTEDDINDENADRMTEFSDVDSGYTNQTSLATSVTCLPSTAFVSIDVRSAKGGTGEESIVVVDDEITATTFEDILHYIYTTNLPPDNEHDLDRQRYERLHRAAKAIGMSDLETATANVLRDEKYLNIELRRKVEADRIQRIEQMFIKQGLLADVVFELEDGTVPAHRALLMCRSDMMVSMFNLDFTERSNKTVPFRNATAGGFRGLMFYLYTGQCPEHCDDWATLIELADRLYLPKLLRNTQLNCVNHLNQMMSSPAADNGGELTDIVLALIDAAKLHKVEQIERWCQWYLQVNFNEVIDKYVKSFEALQPDTQATLISKRWPPEWYLKEVEFYERALMLMTKERPEASWLRRPNGEVQEPTHCFGFLRKK